MRAHMLVLVAAGLAACGKIPDAPGGDDGDDDAPPTGEASLTLVNNNMAQAGVDVTFQAPDGTVQVVQTDGGGKATATIVQDTDIWATWDQTDGGNVQHFVATLVDVDPGDHIAVDEIRTVLNSRTVRLAMPAPIPASRYDIRAGTCSTQWDGTDGTGVIFNLSPDCLSADGSHVTILAAAYDNNNVLVGWSLLDDVVVADNLAFDTWHDQHAGWGGNVLHLPPGATQMGYRLSLVTHGRAIPLQEESELPAQNRSLGGETPLFSDGPHLRRIDVTADHVVDGEVERGVQVFAQHDNGNTSAFDVDFDTALPPIDAVSWDATSHSVVFGIGGSTAAKANLASADGALAAFFWGSQNEQTIWFVIMPPQVTTQPLPLAAPAGFTLPTGSEPGFAPFVGQIISVSYLADYHALLNFPGLSLGDLPTPDSEVTGSVSRYGNK